jgi:hypothetical protein
VRGKSRKITGFVLRIVIAAALLVAVPVVVPQPSDFAHAQNRDDGRRGFNPFAPIFRLFGGGRERRKASKPTKRVTRRPSGTPPAFTAEPKDPDAGIILVVGDRMARGVADGLSFMLSDKPMVKVEKITEDRKGFTGEEPPDWSALALARIRGADVKAVVVMIGPNDMGRVFPGEPPVEFMTDEWIATYKRKVSGLVRAVRQERKPLIWVGLPPTNSELTNEDFTKLNGIFSESALDSRTWFVDLWDIFLNEEGAYSSFGPSVEGKRVRLRSGDKIGFTWAGFHKVAFFVERELSRILGGYGGYAFEGVDDDPNFIVLTGRNTSPEEELLGSANGGGEIDTSSLAYRFFVKGETLPVVPGRVDDTRLDSGPGS